MTTVSTEASQSDYREYIDNIDYCLNLLEENLSPTLLGMMKSDWDQAKNRYQYAATGHIEATRIVNFKVLFNTLQHVKEVVSDLHNGRNKVSFVGKAVFMDVNEFYHDFNRLQVGGEANIIKAFLEKNIDDITSTVDGLAPNLHNDLGLDYQDGQEMTTHTESESDIVNTITEIRDYIFANSQLKGEIGLPGHDGFYNLSKNKPKTEQEKAVASQQALLNILSRLGSMIDIAQSENSSQPMGKLGKGIAILGILISLNKDNQYLDSDALEATLKNAKSHFMHQVRSLLDRLAVEVDSFEMDICLAPNTVQQFITPFVEVFDRLDTEQSKLRHDWLRAKNRQDIIDDNKAGIAELTERLTIIDKVTRIQKAFELESLNNIPGEIYLEIATALGIKDAQADTALFSILEQCSPMLRQQAQVHLAKKLPVAPQGFFGEMWVEVKLAVNQVRNKTGNYGSTPVAFWAEVNAMLAVLAPQYRAEVAHMDLMKVMALEQRTAADVDLLAQHPKAPEADHTFYAPSAVPIVVNEAPDKKQAKKPNAFVQFWITVGRALKTFFQTICHVIEQFFKKLGQSIAKFLTKTKASLSDIASQTQTQTQTSETPAQENGQKGMGHAHILKAIPVGKNNPLQNDDYDSQSSDSFEPTAESYERVFSGADAEPLPMKTAIEPSRGVVSVF